jgi:hypothetical protein
MAYPLWGRITAVPDTATLTIEFYDGWWLQDGAGTPAFIDISTQMWFMGAFFEASDKSVVEWPQTCCFFEERLFLGATSLAPDILYGSRTGSIDDFDIFSAFDSPPTQPAQLAAGGLVSRFLPPNPQSEVLATSALTIGISGSEVAEIQWIRPVQASLIAGTTRSVYQLIAVGENKIFGPTESISSRPTNAIGSTRIGSVALRDRLYFLLPSEERLFMISYRLTQDSYVAQEVSLFNPDILAEGVKGAATSMDPEPVYWAITRDNKLVGITIDADQRVYAWHEHEIAGTDVEIESVAAIPDLDEGADQIWLVVNRTINGVTVRTIEYIQTPFEANDSGSAQHFVDGGVIDFTNTTTIANLGHLEGEEVAAIGDGAYLGLFTVSGGQITIPDSYVEVHAGLLYTAEMQTTPIVVNDPQGSSFGKRQRAAIVNIYMVRSIGGEVAAGPPADLRWRPISQRTGIMPIGVALDPQTDIYNVGIEGMMTRSLVGAYRNRVPFNAEIACMSVHLDSSSR